MNGKLPFGLSIPIIYVNPPLNPDPGLIEAVSRAGGLGVCDHVGGGQSGLSIAPGIPHGVRMHVHDLMCARPAPGLSLAVVPLEDADAVQDAGPDFFKSVQVPVLVEVGNRGQAVAAETAGAAGIIARGNEGPGWVSETSGFVLLQETLDCCTIPVFLQGGVRLHTAAGALAAGASGVVLDVHLLLAAESGLEPALKTFLRSLELPATVTLGESSGQPCRVYARVGTRAIRELRKLEDSLAEQDSSTYRKQVASLMGTRCEGSPDTGEFVIPLSEDIVTARRLAEEYHTAAGIVEAFAASMKRGPRQWPFHETAPVAVAHGTRFPLVQGPMAHVSDNADFLAAVQASGALPFLALGNMPGPIAREALRSAREKTGERFGVGLIGLDVNRSCYEAHMEIMGEDPPPFAILAAGSVELARRIETMGTICYLHCPAPSILSDALKAGLRHFVFEGCESGGHIGTLGSLDLWAANLRELEIAHQDGLLLRDVTVLLAGGIAKGRAAAFIAGMCDGLIRRGLNVGLQMGTAYLSTEEAVSTCAITRTYQRLTLEGRGTVVIGRTVNTRARAAASPMAHTLIGREYERIKDGVPLRERKELYEKDNLGALRLAAKGCAIAPDTATGDNPVFCNVPEERQLEGGLYLMGQVVSLLETPTGMEELHKEIIEGGRRIYEIAHYAVHDVTPAEEQQQAVPPIEMGAEVEPIAVVGIGLRFPGADSPYAFWDAIVQRRSGIGQIPSGRWDRPDFYFDPDPKAPDKTYSQIGGFVTDFSFDPLTYRIPPAVARKMDRTQQFAVACTADALADAGTSPEELRGKRVGIIIGNSMGGETTDQYAARVGLPRALARLEQSLGAMGLPHETRTTLSDDFRSRYLDDLPEITEDSLPGELANVISGRVANVFNLEGPNFTVDAACASSIAAVMNAVVALRQRTIDYAITGGVDAAMHPSSFVKFCKIGALSPDGSRPFDEGANGFVMGEGAGIVVLKRLSDAVRDGDRIYGTIVAIGSSSDGRGKGITAPNALGQERAIRACLDEAGISLDTVGLIEAHGTATPVGDKTELTVLDKMFREAGLNPGSVGIGSVKSQIGHLKAASGAAGLIKALLGLHHRTLPPTINVTRPNPCIDWNTSPVFLVTEARPWETRNGAPRRVGVSAFGFGGTNFHAVLQEHVPGLRMVPGKKQPVTRIEFVPPDWPRPPKMDLTADAWVLGAPNPAELSAAIDHVIPGLRPDTAADLAARCREDARGCQIRCAFAAHDASDAVKKLTLVRDALADPQKRSFLSAKGIHVSQGREERARQGVAFLFPGQGSQYPFMLRDLAERFPVVAQTLAEADDILVSLGRPPVTAMMFPREGSGETNGLATGDAMKETQVLQPMILTVNIAMFRLLAQFGVTPVACAGHSLGEYAACVAAGVFSFRDGLEAVAVRGTEMARVSIADPGIMMSIPGDARVVEEVLSQVEGYVVAANKNSPRQTVISGETAAVKEAADLFRARGLEGTLLPVSAAFHSGVVAPAREPFLKTLKKLTVNPPSVPVISNVTGDFYPTGPAAPDRIRELLGRQFAAPVEWVKTLRRLYSEGVRVFVECGPKRVMTNLTVDTLTEDVVALAANHPKKGGMLQLMETLAALASEGLSVNWGAADEANVTSAGHERRSLRVVGASSERAPEPDQVNAGPVATPLQGLLDDELRHIVAQKEFARFLELQGAPIRDLIKSSFRSFIQNILPMEKTIRLVKSEGIDFQSVVVSGTAAGLPSDVRFPFDRENLDDLIRGHNYIKRVPTDEQHSMVEKNIERLVKGPDGAAELEMVEDVSGVIKLAGSFSDWGLPDGYGLDERLASAMDVTARLALAAGLEALRDAGIPLVLGTRSTSTGHELPDSWALPESLRDETGVIFASAFPGLASLVDEVTVETASRYDSGARKRLIEFYTGLLERIRDDGERDRVSRWFTEEFNRLSPGTSDGLYTFNRNFLFKVLSLASGHLAQYIRARGPNSHVNAACASTTQAILLARDWIRTGQAKRVLVVAADDVAGKTLLPWIGSGFLAMGAATTNGNLAEAALPFDDRRNGLVLGSAAVGLTLEREDLVRERGVEPIVSVEAGIVANSAFHGTRLDVTHISSVMGKMIEKWEAQSGLSRDALARDVFFMSHETYSPKRGGSAAAEIYALRTTFGDNVRLVPIANTKGFTGHTMGVGIEDVVAMRCLQKGTLPPIANLKQPDPEFANLNLSRGGPCKANFALRLAAGFGSQVVMSLYKVVSRQENRLTDLDKHRTWLKQVTGYSDPVVWVEDRTLRVGRRAASDGAEAGEMRAKAVAGPGSRTLEQELAQPSAEDDIREKILSLLVEKTGYPAEMLQTDLDLEADLGIDTVKQAEFIAEVREMFHIPRIEGLKIADFPTIRHIIGFVAEKIGQARTEVSVAVEEETTGEVVTPMQQHIQVFETRLVMLPEPEGLQLPETDQVLIFGGTDDLGQSVAREFRSRGFGQVKRILEPRLPEDARGLSVGIINLFPLGTDGNPVKKTFALYVDCAAAFEQGPSFLIAALCEDGSFGFENPSREGYLAGAVAGATKAFSREFPATRVRVLDLHPEMTEPERARALAQSIEQALPVEIGVAKDGTLKAVRHVPSIRESQQPGIRPEEVVLVTGGGHGITAVCAKYMARQAPLTFVMLGRTSLSGRAEHLARFGPEQWEEEKNKVIERMKRTGTPPTPVMVEKELSRLRAEAEVAQTVRELRAGGSEVIYRSVDICDGDAVDRVIQEVGRLCGRVDVVVYGAGIDASRALRDKPPEQMQAVYSVKVDGMRKLVDSLERHGLLPRRVVGFGSVSGRFGNVAQVDYAAANDGLAHLSRWLEREMDARVSIIDWAPWSEVGMATRGSVRQTLQAAGIDFIPPETGARIFTEELGRDHGSCEVVVAGRLGPFSADGFTVSARETPDGAILAGQRARVVALVPGEYVRATITLDPSHPLLDHHRIARAAVLPGVGGLEIMRSAATLIHADANEASFESVHFHSPLKIFRDDPFEADVEVVRSSGESEGRIALDARIFSWFTDKDGRKVGAPRVHHECRLVVGRPAEVPLSETYPWSSSTWIASHDLYTLFFHGPGFRFLDHVAIEVNGNRVRFRCRDTSQRESMFNDAIPAAIESTFQAAAALGVESRGMMTLPIGVVAAGIHRQDCIPREGELVFRGERVMEGGEGRKVLVFDGVVRDAVGTVVLALKGIEMVELERNAVFSGQLFEETVEVDQMVKTLQADPEEYVVQTLTEEEAQEYQSKSVPKRAAEWLAGRVALKRSVQRLMVASGKEEPRLNEIRVIRDLQGKPMAELPGRPGEKVSHVSLSHSNGLAMAVVSASDGKAGLGLDVEKVEARSESWVNDYFSPEEIVAAGEGAGRWVEFNKMWSIKEAALKALGTGLKFDLKDIDASEMDSDGRCSVTLRNEAAQYGKKSFRGRLEARVEERNGMVIARAITRNTEA